MRALLTHFMAKKKIIVQEEIAIDAKVPVINHNKPVNHVVINGEVVLDPNIANPGVHSPRF